MAEKTADLFDADPPAAPTPAVRRMLIAEVAQPVPLRRSFDYEIPQALKEKAVPGARIRAPFGPRRLNGMILSVREGVPSRPLKPIEAVLDEGPMLTPELVELARWTARRYAASIGECCKALVPTFIRVVSPASAGVQDRVSLDSGIRWNDGEQSSKTFELTPGQAAAYQALSPRLRDHQYSAALLYGVPASGKTEVYLRLMREAVAAGGQVLYLLPEIALTQPFFDELRRRSGVSVALWHSQLGIKERRAVWLGLRSGDIQVVVGARSACLLPFKTLRLIVMDEEQDESYKQEGQAPLYHARDVVLERARVCRALAVLGSATPSMEAMALVEAGQVQLLELPQRVSGRDAGPRVEVLDKPPRRGSCISDELLEQIRDRLGRREQVILLVNRRGFSNFLLCGKCGWVARCKSCGIAYVHHRAETRHSGASRNPDENLPSGPRLPPGRQEAEALFLLRCHHCGRETAVPEKCIGCKDGRLSLMGIGTQKIESEIKRLLPGAKVLRMDRDTVTKEKPQDVRIYDEFKAGRADILVGTKLVAKGYHFPEVTLVGVVDADTMLHMPDFRSSERTVQLLMQAAGRAGRAEKPGEVFVQSSQAGHYAIQAVARGDYLRFARQELGYRRELGYPPLASLVRIVFSATKEETAQKAAQSVADGWRAAIGEDCCEFVGPAPAVYHKLRGRFRYHLLAKLKDPSRGADVMARLAETPAPSGVRMSINVDPYDLF